MSYTSTYLFTRILLYTIPSSFQQSVLSTSLESRCCYCPQLTTQVPEAQGGEACLGDLSPEPMFLTTAMYCPWTGQCGRARVYKQRDWANCLVYSIRSSELCASTEITVAKFSEGMYCLVGHWRGEILSRPVRHRGHPESERHTPHTPATHAATI